MSRLREKSDNLRVEREEKWRGNGDALREPHYGLARFAQRDEKE